MHIKKNSVQTNILKAVKRQLKTGKPCTLYHKKSTLSQIYKKHFEKKYPNRIMGKSYVKTVHKKKI